jgi:hypothetical protein
MTNINKYNNQDSFFITLNAANYTNGINTPFSVTDTKNPPITGQRAFRILCTHHCLLNVSFVYNGFIYNGSQPGTTSRTQTIEAGREDIWYSLSAPDIYRYTIYLDQSVFPIDQSESITATFEFMN